MVQRYLDPISNMQKESKSFSQPILRNSFDNLKSNDRINWDNFQYFLALQITNYDKNTSFFGLVVLHLQLSLRSNGTLGSMGKHEDRSKSLEEAS